MVLAFLLALLEQRGLDWLVGGALGDVLGAIATEVGNFIAQII